MQLTAEQFERIVAEAVSQVSSRRPEQRGAARVGVRYAVTVRPVIRGATGRATSFRGWLRDVSRSGLGLSCPVAVVGDFNIELTNAGGAIHVVRCRARSCRRVTSEAYQVGATFIG